MIMFDFFATGIYCFFLMPKPLAQMVEEKKAERRWNPLTTESRMKQRVSSSPEHKDPDKEAFATLMSEVLR